MSNTAIRSTHEALQNMSHTTKQLLALDHETDASFNVVIHRAHLPSNSLPDLLSSPIVPVQSSFG
jgi:hypothetical protein